MLCLIGANHCTNPPTCGITNVIQASLSYDLGSHNLRNAIWNHHHHGVGDKEKGYKG
jgi:hypothetical protein